MKRATVATVAKVVGVPEIQDLKEGRERDTIATVLAYSIRPFPWCWIMDKANGQLLVCWSPVCGIQARWHNLTEARWTHVVSVATEADILTHDFDDPDDSSWDSRVESGSAEL